MFSSFESPSFFLSALSSGKVELSVVNNATVLKFVKSIIDDDDIGFGMLFLSISLYVPFASEALPSAGIFSLSTYSTVSLSVDSTTFFTAVSSFATLTCDSFLTSLLTSTAFISTLSLTVTVLVDVSRLYCENSAGSALGVIL